MSARKLQQEIDKVNKKIGEGLSIFNGIYDKLMSTDIQSQKEKLESDLKKEIKKLQRMRDQLKNWINNSDIKLDKVVLQSNREKIEYAMEQFKNLEKNMKIKQFSNEGLNLQSVSSNKNLFLDTNQQKKIDAYEFISSVIDELSTQNESLEGKISQLNNGLSKKKSTSLSNSKLEDYQFFLERNNEHLTKLEKVLKLLENEKLNPDLIFELKDDLNYYVESNQDEDFFENELLYDELGLDEEDDDLVANSTSNSINLNNHPASAATAPVGTNGNFSPSPVISQSTLSLNTNTNTNSSTPMRNNFKESTPTLGKKILKPISSSSNNNTPKLNFASIANFSNNSNNNNIGNNNNNSVSNNSIQQPPPGLSKQNSIASATPSPIPNQTNLASTTTTTSISSNVEENEELNFINDLIPNFPTLQNKYKAPTITPETKTALESSLLNCPDSFDAEKPRSYVPSRAHPTSIDYPKEPLYELNSLKIMSKFDNDTLFYCFYYHQGEIWNINAAKILSSRGWVFNKVSKQWLFKIIENDPPTAADSHSALANGNGSEDVKREDWKYFDFEAWLPRRKEGFVFDDDLKEIF